jgi:hypothetical protein
VYQQIRQTYGPETLLGHLFGGEPSQGCRLGYLVTFTGQQARITNPDARANELTATRQKSWAYPDEVIPASEYALEEARRERDVYFGVHLFREPGNRLASNAVATVWSLWLDEDDGRYPDNGPAPSAIVRSSANRRHLYWSLTRPVSVEWAVGMNRRIAAWANGDSGKAGLASVLRVPGTANFKRHPQVDPVTAESYEGGSWEPELMEQAIPLLPTAPTPDRSGPYDGPPVELADYLPNVEVIGEVPDGLGVKYAIVCPWIDEHSGGDRTGTYLGQRTGGGPWFYCNHEHCRRQGRGWQQFKRKIFPVRKIRINRPHTNPNKKVRLDRG